MANPRILPGRVRLFIVLLNIPHKKINLRMKAKNPTKLENFQQLSKN